MFEMKTKDFAEKITEEDIDLAELLYNEVNWNFQIFEATSKYDDLTPCYKMVGLYLA